MRRHRLVVGGGGSEVPGMSAPGAGGETPLPNLCDTAPRDKGDPNRSAGREGLFSPRNAVAVTECSSPCHSQAVAGAARDRLQGAAVEAPQASLTVAVPVTVAPAQAAPASATSTPVVPSAVEHRRNAVVHATHAVAGAARDRLQGAAEEAPQASLAVAVLVTVAPAQAAPASATSSPAVPSAVEQGRRRRRGRRRRLTERSRSRRAFYSVVQLMRQSKGL